MCLAFVFSRLFGVPRVFCFFLKMFLLFALDQVQLTWLTHQKTASLKTHKQRATRVPCSAFLSLARTEFLQPKHTLVSKIKVQLIVRVSSVTADVVEEDSRNSRGPLANVTKPIRNKHDVSLSSSPASLALANKSGGSALSILNLHQSQTPSL